MSDFKIVGIGGANFDVHMRTKRQILLHDSNPAAIAMSPGGVTRNIIENIAKLGLDCSLVSAVGNDAFGDAIMKSLKEAGINSDAVYYDPVHRSSSYVDILDEAGDMYVATCDAEIIENFPLEELDARKDVIQSADIIVTDANWLPHQLEHIISLAGDVPVFIDPVSAAKIVRIREICGSFKLIKPNRLELETLTDIDCSTDEGLLKACEWVLEKGTEMVVVSLGEKGAFYADRKGNRVLRAPKMVKEMVNASGAGDAFLAGFVYGYCNKLSVEDMVDFASACGSIAVESMDTINPLMSEEYVKNYLAK